MSVGKLVVELAASIATFQADLGKAAAEAERQSKRIQRSFDSAADAIKSKLLGLASALGVGFSVVGFVDLIKGAIDAEEELGRVGARAGLTGEQLSTLSAAAAKSRTPLEDVAIMSARLSKALIEGQDSGTKQAAVLRALGISGADTARLLANPTQAVFELAQKLNLLPEGGTKAAAQILILGRAGGTTSAFLNELAKQHGLVVTRTNEEIAAAKEFTDKLVDMERRSTNLKTTLANALLPTLNDIVDAITKLSTGAGGAKDILDKFAADRSLQEWARDAAITVATVAESLIFSGRAANAVLGSFRVAAADIEVALAAANAPKAKLTGSLGFSPEEAVAGNAALDAALAKRNAILATANKNYQDLIDKNGAFLSDALKKQFEQGDLLRRAQSGEFNDPRDIQNKAALEKQAADAARAAAALAKRVQNAVRDASGTAAGGEDPTKKRLEKDIAAIEASLEAEKHVLSAREEFLNAYYQHNDISLDQYYKTREDSITEGLASLEKGFDQEVALTNAFIKTRVELLAKGRTKDPGYATAAKDIEGAEKQIIEITKRRTTAEQDASDKSIKLWFDQRQAVEDYKRATFQATSDEITNRLERINLLQQGGAISDLDALAKSRDAINDKIGLLQKELDVYALLAARAGDTTAGKQAQNNVDALQLKIDRLAVSADALNKKFRDALEGPFESFLSDLENHTKTLGQAVLDLGKNWAKAIGDIVNKDIAQRLFGKDGPLGGAGNFLGGLFGPASKATGSAAADTAVATLATSATLATTALDADVVSYIAASAAADALAASMIAAATAASASAGGNYAAAIAAATAAGGSFAVGTDYVPRDMIAKIHQGEAIIPAAQNRQGGKRGHTYHIPITVNVLRGATRESASQAAAAMGIEIRRALAREM